MKTAFFFLLIFFTFSIAKSQQINVNATRFVGSDTNCYVNTRFAISTEDKGVFFVGTTNCYSGGGNIPFNFPDTTGADQGNVFIGKLDSSLNLSWVKIYGGNRLDYGVSAVQTLDGGYAILATTESNDINVSGNHGFGVGDLWLVKIDRTGSLLWQKCYGSVYDEQAISISLTPDSGFILLGVSNGVGGDVPTHYSGSQADYDWFVVKTDSVGNKEWAKSIGGTGDENPYGSILSVGNSYYLVGSSNSTNYDCTDTSWHPGVYSGNDYYVFKLDAMGSILWDSSYGSIGGEEAYSAIWDNRSNSIVMTGVTTGNDYMVSGNHGQWDMWVIETDSDGVLKWQKCLGGIGIEQGTGITSSEDGYLALGSSVPGSIGHQDAWLFALDLYGNLLTDKQFGGLQYEDPSSIISFKKGYLSIGTSNSQGFTEGLNLGFLPNPTDASFFTYTDYRPLLATQIAKNDKLLILYPNPTNEFVRITVPDIEAADLCILNNLGQSIFSTTLRQKESYLDIDTMKWSSGVYIVKWLGENGTVLTTRFVKN